MVERKKRYGVIQLMNKQLTFILALSFISYFSDSSYSEELEVKKEYWRNGNLKSETHYNVEQRIIRQVFLKRIKSN